MTKIHSEIKKNPTFVKATKKTFSKSDRKYKPLCKKLTKAERDKKVKIKIKKIFKGKN